MSLVIGLGFVKMVYTGWKSSQVEGGRAASAPTKLSRACHCAKAETVGTEEVRAYMAGHCVSGTDTVPNLCLQEMELISQLQTCFFSRGNKGSCYNDTIRERLGSVHGKFIPIPVCALVVFHEHDLTAVMDICIVLFQKQMEFRALPVLP